MFYSHEILTSKRYGVATVWLVATLGSKPSTTKKINRKAILEVNVQKACETIIQPEAPLALRLQSNLLYGVSRVYSEQCGYILADAQTAQNTLRNLLRAVKHNELDPNAGKAQPNQLLLMDDPAFMPDMLMPGIDFDLSNLDIKGLAMLDTQDSEMSPRTNSRLNSSAEAGSLLGMVIPESDVGSYRLPRREGIQLPGSEASKMSGLVGAFPGEEDQLIDDFDFEFDADGVMRDIDVGERDQLRSSGGVPHVRQIGSDSGAIERVRRDHEEARVRRLGGVAIEADDDIIVQFDDEIALLPSAEPFTPLKAASQPMSAQFERVQSPFTVVVTSSISAEAPLRKRKRGITKTITPDEQIELTNSNLRTWQNDYLTNMDAAVQVRKMHRAPYLAKKNAFSWVYGNGIGEIGRGIGFSALPSPLEMFSGANLVATITGTPAVVAPSLSPKHPRDDDDEEKDIEARRVRIRPATDGNQVGRAPHEEDILPFFEDSALPEVGRDAPSALDDHPSSAMPWNISASLNSFRNMNMNSSSLQGRNALFPPIGGSRLTSASPLLGRGQIQSGIQEMMDQEHDVEGPVTRLNLAALRGRDFPRDLEAEEGEFEMIGPAAENDTQITQGSQWAKEALARESLHFLDFVRGSLRELKGDEVFRDFDDEDVGVAVEEEDDGVREEEKERGMQERRGMITFETLFPPQINSMMVAAQAFHHVLSLASKSLLHVRQEEGFGDIWIGTRVVDASVDVMS